MTNRVNIQIVLDGLTKSIEGFDNLGKATDRLGDSLVKVGEKGMALGKSLTKNVTVPLTAAGVAAGKLASDFETAFSRIEGLVGIATSEIDSLREGVLDLAGETAKSPLELADALFTVTSAGFRGQEALDVLTSAAKASAAGLGETRSVAEALTGAVNAYGPAVLNAARATEIITATARAGNFATEDLANSLGRVTPFAQAAQVSFQDVGGAIAVLTRINNDATQSIFQVTALLRSFSAPTTQTISALEDLGLTTTELRESMGENGLVATLKMLDEKLGGNRDALREIIPDSQGFSAALTILNADASVLEGTFGVVANSAGILDEAFNAAANTSGFAFSQSLSALKQAMISVGDVILPIIVPGIQALTGALLAATAAFNGLTPEVQRTAVIIAAAFGVGGPVIFALGLFIKAVGLAIKVMGPTFANAGKIMVGTIRFIALNFMAFAGPAGVIALVVAAVIGLVGVWQKWGDDIKQIISNTLETVGGWFNSFKERTVTVWTNITDGIKRVFVEPLVAIFNKVRELFTMVGGWYIKLAELMGVNTGNIRDFVTGAFGEIQVKVRESVDKTVDFTMQAFDGLAQGLGTITDEVVDTFAVGWQTISDEVGGVVSNMIDTTVNDFGQMGTDIEAELRELRNSTLELTAQTGEGLAANIGDGTALATASISTMASETGIAMTDWSQKLTGAAEDAANGWLDQVNIISGDTKLTLGDLFEVTLAGALEWVKGMGSVFGGFFDWIGGAFSGLGDFLGGAATSIGTALSGGAGAAGAGGAGAAAGSVGGFGGIAPFAAAFAGVAGLVSLFSGGARDVNPALLDIGGFTSFARGTDSVFSSPQLIQVGENGSERVTVSPLNGGSPGGGGNVFNFNAPTVFDGLSMNRFENRIANKLRSQAVF